MNTCRTRESPIGYAPYFWPVLVYVPALSALAGGVLSAHVSALPDEGQFLPEVRVEMRAAAWEPHVDVDWARIKTVWDGYWDHTRPILVEKSPPNAGRAQAIAEHFAPLWVVAGVVAELLRETPGAPRR